MARIGFFNTFIKALTVPAHEKDQNIEFAKRAVASLSAGGMAVMIGNQADLALIQMQSDGLKPVAERKNFKSVIDALSSIVKNEGVLRLWAGAAPTVVRAMAFNFGQLAFFSEAKSQLKSTSLYPKAQTLTASAVASFFASALSLPFDFRQDSPPKADQGSEWKTAIRIND